MNLREKIEEIQKKPEHIRLRYIWLFVFIAMLFVVAIWILSLKANNFKKNEKTGSYPANLSELSDEIEKQKIILKKDAANAPIEEMNDGKVMKNGDGYPLFSE